MTEQKKFVRKKIRRRGDPNVPHDDNKLYFSSKTQAAIVRYQQEPDVPTKQKIYLNEIMPAFVKLVDNLVSIHKFNPVQETHEEVRNDCVTFLFETIHKFDATRGTNAFSYFNVVAKNWLIIHFKHNAQRMRRMVSVNAEMNSDDSTSMIEETAEDSIEESIIEKERFIDAVESLYSIRDNTTTPNELLCVNSLIEIFEKVNDLDVISRNAVNIYMREITGLSQKQISIAMASIKQRFKSMKAMRFM